jgi:hypothetical protein
MPRELHEGRQQDNEHLQGLPPGARHRLGRPAGVLHAPGSLCTYEPQVASDVYAMYQSLVDNQIARTPCSGRTAPRSASETSTT